MISIHSRIMNSSSKKEMKYYLSQAKRKLASMRRSVETPQEAIDKHKRMKLIQKDILESIETCERNVEWFPKLGVAIFLTIWLGVIIVLMTIYDITILTTLFTIFSSAFIAFMFVCMLKINEIQNFINSGEPQKDVKNFVKKQEELLLDKFKNMRKNPYSGKLEELHNEENA